MAQVGSAPHRALGGVNVGSYAPTHAASASRCAQGASQLERASRGQGQARACERARSARLYSSSLVLPPIVSLSDATDATDPSPT
eukprot:5811481-Pleurochrysis_carterae.AAC.2